MTKLTKRLRHLRACRADKLADALLCAEGREIKHRDVIRRLDGLARSAAGHIANKGIADDFRKNIGLCQVVDLEPARICAARVARGEDDFDWDEWAKRVGQLMDTWQQAPNDVRSMIKAEYGELVEKLDHLYAFTDLGK